MVTLVFIFILKRTSDVAKGTEGNQEAAKMGVIRGSSSSRLLGRPHCSPARTPVN